MVIASLIQASLDGAMTLADAQAVYRSFVTADRRRYHGLFWGNLLLLGLPQRVLGKMTLLMARPRFLQWFFMHYLGIFARPDAARFIEPQAMTPPALPDHRRP